MATCLHLGHPAPEYQGDISDVVGQFLAMPATERPCPDWVVRSYPYRRDYSLDARNFSSTVLSTPGPVLLLLPHQRKSIQEIRQRLEGRQLVATAESFDLETLFDAVANLLQQHTSGEPLLPLDRVVALLLLRKLDQERMWTGNAKGYMWADDIPKGRGIDERFASRVPHVLNVLLNHHLLVRKTSNSSSKFGLNPDYRVQIYKILSDRMFPEPINGMLNRQPLNETARSLDLLDIYNEATK